MYMFGLDLKKNVPWLDPPMSTTDLEDLFSRKRMEVSQPRSSKKYAYVKMENNMIDIL